MSRGAAWRGVRSSLSPFLHPFPFRESPVGAFLSFLLCYLLPSLSSLPPFLSTPNVLRLCPTVDGASPPSFARTGGGEGVGREATRGQNPYGTSDSRTLLLGIDHPSQSMLTTLLTDGEINYLDNAQRQSGPVTSDARPRSAGLAARDRGNKRLARGRENRELSARSVVKVFRECVRCFTSAGARRIIENRRNRIGGQIGERSRAAARPGRWAKWDAPWCAERFNCNGATKQRGKKRTVDRIVLPLC